MQVKGLQESLKTVAEGVQEHSLATDSALREISNGISGIVMEVSEDNSCNMRFYESMQCSLPAMIIRMQF